MFARLAIPIVLFVAWCFACQYWYVCHIKQQCDEVPAVVVPAEPAPEFDNRPLVFNWDDATAITSTGFSVTRDSILGQLKDGQILEIVGQYSKEETAPEGFPNMGMARATKIRDLLSEFIPIDRMLPVSRLVKLPGDARTKPFESVSFNYLDPSEEEEAEIVELNNRIIIQFPFSSAEKKSDPKVDAYLTTLAERLKSTDETVSITGHTDDVGGDKTNISLGRARAGHIKRILMKKGIAKDQISVDSKGESEPVADNGTDAGRRKNRRAELVLNKK
ncbi:MAG: OOP family OmpA-OmpF porin [Saprospiraceae bacterium]|jgi:OOP family OmpA-OmpF porin